MFAWLWLVIVIAAPPPDSELDWAVALLESLESKTISIDYQQERLSLVLNDLSARIGVPVRGDWNSLERLGISSSDRVTLQFDSTSASTVLAALTLTVGDDVERPVLEAHAGQIILTRIAAIGAMRLTAVYDVRDLLADEALVKRLKDESPAIEPAQDTQAGDPDPTGSATSPGSAQDQSGKRQGEEPIDPAFANLEPVPSEVRPLSPGERLLLLITDHVDPEAWMNFGGNRALISETNGVLLVSATPSTHRRMQAALRSLRSANATTISIDAVLLDLPRATHDALSRKHSHDETSLAAAAAASADAKMIWRCNDPVSIGEKLEIESSALPTSIRLSFVPNLDRATGLVRINVDAATITGDDRRRVATSVSLHSDQRAIAIELPAATATDSVRFLVLTVRR